MESYDFSNMEFGDFDSASTEAIEPFEQEFKLADGVSLAIVDSDQAVCDYLSNLFGGSVDSAHNLAALEPQLGLEARVVILGPSCANEHELGVVQAWSMQYPQLATVLVTSEESAELLRLALRSGVKDVLSAPIDPEGLVDTVQRVAEALPSATQLVAPSNSAPGSSASKPEGHGQVLTVFSTKGGSGKSVAATNLGVVLARRIPGRVVVVDANFQFGDVAVMLKLQQHDLSVADAVERADELDNDMISSFMIKHEPSGLEVLPAPTEPVLADDISVEAFMKVIDVLRSYADFVIVDLPAHLDDLSFRVLKDSDQVLLVTGLDIPNIKNVRIAMNVLGMLGISSVKVSLVLNRANSKVKLEVSEVEKALDIEAKAHIPSDVVVPISVNKGSPVVISAPKSGVARAFEEFGARIMEESPVASVPAEGNKRKIFG